MTDTATKTSGPARAGADRERTPGQRNPAAGPEPHAGGQAGKCACGQPIKPCPLPLDAQPSICGGYVHELTLTHHCPGGTGLARPGKGASDT